MYFKYVEFVPRGELEGIAEVEAEIGAVFYHDGEEVIYDLFDVGGIRVKIKPIEKKVHQKTRREYPSIIKFNILDELIGSIKEGILVEEVIFNYVEGNIDPPPLYLRFLSQGMQEIMLTL